MDWNDIQDKLRKIRAPQVRSDPPGSPGGGDSLTARLRAHDAVEREKLRKSRWLFWVATALLGLVFVGVWLVPPGPLYASRIVYQGVLLAAFVDATLALHRRLWALARVDYTQPASRFLEQAERRYTFMRPGDYAVMLVGLLVLGMGSAPYVIRLFLNRYVAPQHEAAVVVGYGIGYLLICGLGLYFTYCNWKRDKAPLLEDIRKHKAALQNEGGPP